MRKTLLAKGIILGMILTTASFGTVEAEHFTTGDITVSSVNLTTGNLIDETGTYTVTAGDGTLTVNKTTGGKLISAAGGAEITFNGNIEGTTSNGWSSAICSDGAGSSITVNGTTKMDVSQIGNIGVPILATNGSKIDFNGLFTLNSYVKNVSSTSATAIQALEEGTVMNFNGGLNMHHTFANFTGTAGGGNGIYAKNGATINIGGDECVLYTISFKPDCISAKNKGVINITSKKVQIVGNIDFDNRSDPGGTVKVIFDGADSFWYGDELCVNNPSAIEGVLDVTYKNGAEYVPFGILSENDYGAKKYLSAITFGEGGIINLYDADAKAKWQELGLDTLYPAINKTTLDYILLGDIKGSNGIFRLDMNDVDKAKTDMIYILNSSSGDGRNSIEAYNEDQFQNVSATNTLRFASVAAAGADKLVFQDKVNLYGTSLWDYELLIGHSAYDVSDPENAVYNGSRDGLTAAQIDSLMTGGTNWYIYGLNKKASDTTLTVVDGINSGYDLATYLDRYNKRHGEAKFLDDDSNLWVRMQRGSLGRDNQYDGMYTMGQLGLEFGKENNHYGFAYEYLDGSFNLESKYGKTENTRKSFMLYDTITDGKGGYLDLVARYGKVYSDLTASTRTGASLDGDYSNTTYGLSAEYGKKFQKAGKDFFFEPQIQLAYNKVGSADYTTDNGVGVHLESANSLVGRLGFRVGRDIGKDSNVYFKADVLREFTGGQDYNLTSGKYPYSGSVEKKGTWYDVGIGADIRLAKKTYFTCDLERSFGSSLANNWEINAGLKWAF